MHKTLTTTLLLALSFNAAAAPRVVNEMTSTAGETRVSFVSRVASFLDTWTAEHGAEACGVIVDGVDAYSVRLLTIDSQLNCAYDRSLVGDTIHSHPEHDSHGSVRLTKETIAAMPEYEGQFTVKVNARTFSKADYKRPGYLVTHGKLLYQSGKGTDALVAKL